MFDDIFNQLPKNPGQILEFIIIYVIFRGIFSKWLGAYFVKYFFDPINRWIKRRLIKTERDVAIYIHYRNKAMHKGHQHKDPIICNDDRCILL